MRVIHVVAYSSNLFSFLCSSPLYEYAKKFICSTLFGPLGCYHLGAIISNAAISIFEHVFFICAHISDGIYLELLGHSIMLNFNK